MREGVRWKGRLKREEKVRREDDERRRKKGDI